MNSFPMGTRLFELCRVANESLVNIFLITKKKEYKKIIIIYRSNFVINTTYKRKLKVTNKMFENFSSYEYVRFSSSEIPRYKHKLHTDPPFPPSMY